MSCNLPLIVIDLKENKFEGYKLLGTTAPYWSDDCGVLVDNLDEFNIVFDNFYNDLNQYEPYKLVQEYLTFEKAREELLSLFETISD